MVAGARLPWRAEPRAMKCLVATRGLPQQRLPRHELLCFLYWPDSAPALARACLERRNVVPSV